MRIALLHPYSWPAVRRGGERYLHDLARWLSERGHDVTVVTGPTDHAQAGVRTVQVRLVEPDVEGLSALDTFGASCLPHLARHRYDVVHSFVPSGGIAAALTLQPSVYTALGHPSGANLPAYPWSRALLGRAVRAVRVPAGLSASAARGIEEVTGRRPVVLPPGTRTQEFAPKAAAPAEPRIAFNAYAGDARKRLVHLLEAMPLVLERVPGARLRLGGGGDPSEAMDRLDPGVRRVVEGCVDDLGPGELEDVPQRFRDASVSVLPSLHEAFGLVLVESLATGTPVVCSDSGGMPEIVDDPKVGRVARPHDVADLARCVVEALALAADPATVAACAAHARRWDWDAVGPLHELAYARARA